jgi:iron complex outermembrane receptor protein
MCMPALIPYKVRKMKRLLLFVLIAISQRSFAQSGGQIKGQIVDETSHEALPFTSVAVIQKNNENSKIIGVAQTAIDGRFQISSLPKGNFLLHIPMWAIKQLSRCSL